MPATDSFFTVSACEIQMRLPYQPWQPMVVAVEQQQTKIVSTDRPGRGSQMKIGTPFGSESSGREWPHPPPVAAPPQHARVHRLQGPRGYGFGSSPTIARNKASLSS